MHLLSGTREKHECDAANQRTQKAKEHREKPEESLKSAINNKEKKKTCAA